MARPLRIEYPGACYDVSNLGNYRQPPFPEKATEEAFVPAVVLGEAGGRPDTKV